MASFKAVAISMALALGPLAAHADPDLQGAPVDLVDSCHKGLVIWWPLKQDKCGFVQTPQVKIFDANGRLRYIGTLVDALQWAKAGLPKTPIPKGVLVRDTAAESRLTHAAAPPAGQAWVTYYGMKGCEPCVRYLAAFRSEVLPKLGAGTRVAVFLITAPGE